MSTTGDVQLCLLIMKIEFFDKLNFMPISLSVYTLVYKTDFGYKLSVCREHSIEGV